MRIAALAFALLIAPVAAWGQAVSPTVPVAVPTILETQAESLARDAGEYARQFDVSLSEATERLSVQDASVAATDTIAETYRDRLAGIAIEHRPSYRIVVYLTGSEAVPEQALTTDAKTVPIVFRTGAKVTRERVIWAMTYHQAAIRAALRAPPGMGLDPRTGELVVIIGSLDAADGTDALKMRLETIAGVPVQIRVLNHVDVNLASPSLPEGGARVEGINPEDSKRYLCTTGFNVTDGARTAVTTAAHCVDQLSYRDPQGISVPLAFVGQWGWGYHDVQINTAPAPLPPTFYADTAKSRLRTVTGQRSRTSTRAGDFVCHRGERTGFSCALVQLTDFAPAGDLCGGPCLPTWVTVAGPTCKGGDSGSPVFTGTTALGILKGASYRSDGSCAFYFYMSVDYLPQGWSLLRVDPSLALTPFPL